MRVSLIIDDNTVYVGTRCANIDLSELRGHIRAVQWQEHSVDVGHVEAVNCENMPLTSGEFLEKFQKYVTLAELAIAAADNAARQQEEQRQIEAAALEELHVFAERLP